MLTRIVLMISKVVLKRTSLFEPPWYRTPFTQPGIDALTAKNRNVAYRDIRLVDVSNVFVAIRLSGKWEFAR